MKPSLLLCALLVCNAMWVLVYMQQKADFDDLRFLASEPTLQEVYERFGLPEEIVKRGMKIKQQGWKTPSRAVSNEALIYTRRTGSRLIIFVNNEANIEYVFVSHS